MILGYHVIIGTYGFWLPNDPRGSWSSFVGSWELLRFGKATTVNVRQSVARSEHDWFDRMRAKQVLKYPPVIFNGYQAKAVALAFGEYAASIQLPIWSFAVMPEHLHMVVGRVSSKDIETVVNQMKGTATRNLDAAAIHPHQAQRTKSGRLPKMFARSSWNVFLDSAADIERAIRYVRDNPLRENRPAQQWSFITPFNPSCLAATRPQRGERGG